MVLVLELSGRFLDVCEGGESNGTIITVSKKWHSLGGSVLAGRV